MPQDCFQVFTFIYLQLLELCGCTKKTLWQLCQLVAAKIPGEVRDQAGVRGCIARQYDRQTENYKAPDAGHPLQCKLRHS